jgi:hypothetical protein
MRDGVGQALCLPFYFNEPPLSNGYLSPSFLTIFSSQTGREVPPHPVGEGWGEGV